MISAAALALLAPPTLHSATLADADAAQVRSPAVRRVIAGRTAGAPVGCVEQLQPLEVRIVDRSAILWRTRASRFYLNFPPRSCDALRADRTLVTRGGRLCAGDYVRVLARGGVPAGRCRLGRFVPYTR